MGIYTVTNSVKPTLAIMKKNHKFFLSFTLYINIFVNFAPFSITGPVTYYFIHHYNHLHS